LYNFTIMILVADMQTVKFRRSRVVMLVGFLILVSSAGYWFTYVSSRPGSQLSDIPNYVDTVNLRQSHSHKYIQSNKLTKPQLGQSNSVKNDANIHNDDVDWRNEKRHSFKYGKGYKQTNAERRGTELKGDDYSEEEAIDDVIQSKNVDAAAQVGHAREHSNDELPAGHHADDKDELPVGHHGDDNDADKLHKKGDKKVSGIKGEVGVYNFIDSPQVMVITMTTTMMTLSSTWQRKLLHGPPLRTWIDFTTLTTIVRPEIVSSRRDHGDGKTWRTLVTMMMLMLRIVVERGI